MTKMKKGNKVDKEIRGSFDYENENKKKIEEIGKAREVRMNWTDPN